MSVRAFFDTNIFICLYSEDEDIKRDAAYRVLNNYDCITSTQALNEASNVWCKISWGKNKIEEHINNIEKICDELMIIQKKTILNALDLKFRYGYSYYDCLMLASALESACDIILTEDMSEGQIIENRLRIVNPFKEIL